MKIHHKLATAGAVAATAIALSAASAAAATPSRDFDQHFGGGAVYVQSDNATANTVLAYSRASNGTLTQAGVYPTGGAGGALTGAAVDDLASQSSLVYSGGLLFAVNAGSNTVSVFQAHGTQLSLTQQISSGGNFPVSIAVNGNLVYVLNARSGGTLQGYYLFFGRLFPIPGSSRALGLDPTQTPEFTHTPGQVGFTPDGRQLIVTTKGNGSDIDVFGLDWLGRPSAAPVVNSEPGAVPFSFVFNAAGQLEVAEAGTNAVATFSLARSGTVTQLATLPTAQPATCWITQAGGVLYASNAGGPTLSSVSDQPFGTLSLLATTTTEKGTVDATTTPDGRFLYVQAGGPGDVDEFAIGSAGALTPIGTLTVPGAAGGEGIAAS